MKRGSETLAISLIVAVLFLLLAAFYVTMQQGLLSRSLTGKVIFSPTSPTDCSDAQIKAAWDFIMAWVGIREETLSRVYWQLKVVCHRPCEMCNR